MRDNALAKELHRQQHDALMLPMYLPLTLDEDAASPDTPIFFGGVSTYLREKFPWFRHMPRWLDRLLSQRALLKLLAGKAAARTGGPDVAEMTLSMLRGEQGNQAGEIEELISWLREHGKPEAIWLSTALQAGLAKRLRAELGVPVIGFLQGEDSFIDGLGEPWTPQVWRLLGERMRDADAWVAPSRYFTDRMAERMGWSAEESRQRVKVIPNGIGLEGYSAQPPVPPATPTIGYLARFIPVKGISILLEAFLLLKKQPEFAALKLKCAGSMTEWDAKYVEKLKARAATAGHSADVEWFPNVSREDKISFLESLTVFSVPATYSEAFGQYAIEALAAGVPIVEPRASAFPEIIESSGAGVLFTPGKDEAESARNLAEALAGVLRDPPRSNELRQKAWESARQEFSMTRLAERLVALTRETKEGGLVGAQRAG